MTRLRESTKREIQETLESTYFTASSFSVKHNEKNTRFLQIFFLPNPEMNFSVRTNTQPGRGFISHEAPGIHIESGEEYTREDIGSCIRAIKSWASRIHEDYKARNPVLDEFEKFKKQMAEQFNEHLTDPSAHFTEDEISALKEKLDSLAKKLDEITDKNYATEKKLDAALKEIEQVKSDLSVFPKAVWYRVAGGKILNAIKGVATSSEGRQLALEAAKKYLLSSPGN